MVIFRKRRLEGPVPERVLRVTRPVVAETTDRPWRELIWFPLMVGLLMAFTFLMVTVRTEPFQLPGNILLIIETVLLFILFLYVIPQIANQALATRVVLETDGLFMMMGDWVVCSMRFSRKVTVEISVPEGLTEVGIEDVEAFLFAKGFSSIRFSVGREDTARFWPVVEAAAWKHRMELGEDIERLLKM